MRHSEQAKRLLTKLAGPERFLFLGGASIVAIIIAVDMIARRMA